ncbi:transcription initiation factor tfiid [Plasmopara halstedii]|uniref:Transcription initiation factor tfiid n=1 Tax=Plasmopara halstedii TaxID=4781 RepID=A0A0P1ARP0_PLAHL|nr:transcription initiation factor tfiid [Plasmopara halstedii]CEG43960.1 transcription initiation factor tfiid [Plasmopara halstedii]|eukprot:XP_024580329.1 transcription initiation factor tfiid [Plasmopara halstedii]
MSSFAASGGLDTSARPVPSPLLELTDSSQALPIATRQSLDNASNTETNVSVMDELLLKYLQTRGYDISKRDAYHHHVTEEERRRILGDQAARIENASIHKYAQQMGLTTEACTANHLLFYGLTDGNPETYNDAYGQLVDWICNSLDMYRNELHAIAFPIFVHCFLELLGKGFVEAGRNFFHRYAADHTRLHLEELRTLSLIFTTQHLRENEYVREVLHSKFNVEISLLSFELLITFLSQTHLFLLLAIVNERVNIVVTSNQPGLQIQQLQDTSSQDQILNNLEAKNDAASGFKTSDELAKNVAASEHPSESEIAVPLTTGPYDMDYMVRAANGSAASTGPMGYSVLDLNAIPVQWGVLPERKVHDPLAEEDEDDDGKDGDIMPSNGALANSSISVGGDDVGAVDRDKKADGLKDKTKTSTLLSDANRKHKRVKLSFDGSAGTRKEALEETGPLPDRKNAFNAELMEKLVLRVPADMKEHILEDIRVRAPVSRSALPSALCFTLLNSATHINNMCFSDDVTMVGAVCDDASFRVWRNDEHPLGTATGSVYHGGTRPSFTDAEEDERMAVLRGHTGAVYGASFSPDNRFALTASADSTVRLWSLAAKSNLVVYRSHQGAPVWDVIFAPLGYYFATCSMDRTARLWSTDHMSPLRILAGHLSDVECVRFHPNHNYVATGSSDKTVRLWDVQTGRCVRVFTGHFRGVQSLAFSHNGQYLASSGEDQYINIWDLQAGKRLETLMGHKAMVTSLDFSRESTILASGGLDSTVRLWDMKALTEKSTTISNISGAMKDLHVNSSITASPKGDKLAGRSWFVKPVPMVRPGGRQELPSSRFLLKTLRSKQTPMYRVHFTPRNLLLAGGIFQPKSDT